MEPHVALSTAHQSPEQRDPPGTPLIERVTLVVGLLFCATTVARFVAVRGATHLAARDPAAFGQVLQQYRRVAEMFGFPLGIATFTLLLLGVLRARDFGARRVRLWLITLTLLLLMALANLLWLNPLEQRFATATGADFAPLATAVPRLMQWHWLRIGFAAAVAALLVLAHRAPRPVAVEVGLDALSAQHRRLLFLLGSATLFEGYDRFITSLALPYIGDDLGAGERGLGTLLAVIRAGALLSLLPGRLADRFGRRRVLIATVTVYTLATAATGVSSGLVDFALFQVVAAVFLTAELSIAQVVIAEELPVAMRGFGQGVLGATAAFGAGVAAMLFPVLQSTAYGWRGMYLIGVLPLVVLAYLRRALPETRRWQRFGGRHAPPRISDLLRGASRRQLLILTVLAAGASAASACGVGFASHRATTAFHWEPSQVSAMIIGAGAVGLCGYFIIGRIVDAVGRRTVGAVGLVSLGVTLALFYRTEHLVLAFAGMTVSDAATLIAINSLSTELFPTALRATAKSWVSTSAVVGAMIGLAMIGVAGGVAPAATIITLLGAMTSLLGPLILLLPETSRTELFELDSGPMSAGDGGTGRTG